MKEDLIKVEVSTKEVTKKDGTTFLAFKGLTKKGWYDLKFKQNCENVPTHNCIIYVEKSKINVNRQGKYPVIWVETVAEIEEIKYNQNVEDYFD